MPSCVPRSLVARYLQARLEIDVIILQDGGQSSAEHRSSNPTEQRLTNVGERIGTDWRWSMDLLP